VQTSNPAFSNSAVGRFERAGISTATMTVQGTAIKSLVLLMILLACAAFTWTATEQGQITSGLLFGSMIGGMVLGFVTVFKPTWAPWTAPVYAACEGMFLGAISRIFELRYPGIAFNAMALTGGVSLIMFFTYATGLIKVTGQLTSAIVAATGAIALVYLVSMLVNAFGGKVPYLYSSGPIGIGFSLFVVGLAAFNLLLDFDFIDRGSRSGLAKSMEWYGAFGLMVTLVWLYLELLRLLRLFADRR
jgi:uncharacterized YccA/Bax inhibitor family protein